MFSLESPIPTQGSNITRTFGKKKIIIHGWWSGSSGKMPA
jgi:hypothetical protein